MERELQQAKNVTSGGSPHDSSEVGSEKPRGRDGVLDDGPRQRGCRVAGISAGLVGCSHFGTLVRMGDFGVR
jgi:hypothetical protein